MSRKKINTTKIEKQKNAFSVRKPIFFFQTVKGKQVRSNEQCCTTFCLFISKMDARAENLLRFEEITQQFSINKTCCGKLMPSSGVEARYNVISSNHI